MMKFAQKVWGVGTPKGFRAASWVVALTVFGTWYYYDHRPTDIAKSLPEIKKN